MTDVILIGSNPGVTLFENDRRTAIASVWQVDWSERGTGNAIVLWHDGKVRVLASDLALGEWLASYFVRHFPEAEGVAWPEPHLEQHDVFVEIDLATGVTATAGDVEVTMAGVLDRRMFSTDEFRLDDVPHGLSLVLCPMRDASVVIGGTPVPGWVKSSGTPERPGSSAFVSTAEAWSRA